ncbi:aminodeoxychorismate synthase component I [Ramlibacter sp. AW1]|uniref:Aminodeoxychorismate synthase component I n=1 Tax=Ramlibacter aurantiacus TaxID=2801330 RepID=A0A936ZYF6_9BURK|nr:aminodeoxychorismate synthase component I [Ramlibacter aurantiacus]MBL0423360.1 aminodeoxychorismate synthase component I [Ramlibacter aurantiacus]
MTPHAVIDFSAGDLDPIQVAFATPEIELAAWLPSEVHAVLQSVDDWARRGYWCVGYLRHEAATAFEPRAAVHAADGPLAWFSVHREPVAFPATDLEAAEALKWKPMLDRAGFDAGIERIHQAIADGEVYQVNYTAAWDAAFAGDPFALFCALRRAQPRANAAFLSNAHEQVLSVSPELFFDWHGEVLRCAPMKGTTARGDSPESDRAQAEALRASAKERAENVMIVDLIRNDLSRLAEPGSVQVPRLFHCEGWPTVWQMTSQVQARTRPGTRLADVFGALFPCGSVTGAPKLRAMHWIRELEPQPRGVYCGAVGVVRPGGDARFNVPIRTVVVREGRARCGIGSGITWDAEADAEWREWSQKAAFLEQAAQPFQLLQTLRHDSGQWHGLALHLDRLAAAAEHFGFLFDRAGVQARLAAALRGRAGEGRSRVRVMVDPAGRAQVDVSPPPATPEGTLRVRLASRPIDAPMAFLRHKTTRRAHYEAFDADADGCFDALLWNAAGEVTEFTRGNVVVEFDDGRIVTPPLSCGLLDGVGRAMELAAGGVQEAVVRVGDLARARRIWFVNALRGRLPVRLER